MRIIEIVEHKDCLSYLQSHQLIDQYQKAKQKMLAGDFKSVDFKKRQPYKSEKYYFRINKKYRAIGYLEDSRFIVFEIDDHQK